MDTDYPAAHSMDTCFFAVDQDGHVACFETREAGALPVNILSGDQAYDVRDRLATLALVEVIHDRRGRTIPIRASEAEEQGSHALLPTGGILMFLASLDAVQEEVRAGRAVQVPASEGVAVVFHDLSEELAEKLHNSGACLSCFWHFPEVAHPNLAARGFFTYEHLTENWISGPYGRACCPAQPIHIDQLPPQLRAAIGAMTFSLCFAQTLHIQPVEHAECTSFQKAYLDAGGRHIRAFPGKEDEYSGAYDGLARFGSHYNIAVEPPARPTGDGDPK